MWAALASGADRLHPAARHAHPAARQAHPAAAVVLGARAFAPHGRGFGTAHPALIDNGGDASGVVTAIHWQRWGRPSAAGHGLNTMFKPGGGYYRKPVRIELRAYDLGRCTRRGPLAYRMLMARLPVRPGGPEGRWFRWAGSRTICRFGS